MLTTPLRNLKPRRVLVRLQNSARVRHATPREIAELADVLVSRCPEDETWVAVSSDAKSKFGTVLVKE